MVAEVDRPADRQAHQADRSTSAERWDNLVTAHGGGLLQSWLWGEFKSLSGWEARRLSVPASGSSSPEIGAQVLYRGLPRLPLKMSIGYIPRGPVHMNLTPAAEQAFWNRVHTLSRRKGAIFLKVEPPVELSESITRVEIDRRMGALGFSPSGRLQPARTIVLDIDKPEDALLAAMKPKTRYNLRLAGRRGVVVRSAKTKDDLRALYSLLQVTGERDEFGIHTFPYYEQMWRTFGPEGSNTLKVLLADHPDEAERQEGPVAGLLALRFGKEAIYMYGASANKGREHMPNYLLQWEAIKWARESGCSVYDFWGIPDAPADEDAEGESSPTNTRSGLRGVYWFKKGFGGREIEYPGAYDYVYNPLLYKLWMRWRGANLG
ncbi:MAG TPA: peptidoglycan bridge formation glycyltransferase FemA/FemB family protein [Chloroflexia bacterium]|nr:peptidoglycan bridge formation glycyltransferase FemA/FemB family protein [Chloroflexia bacterium]